MATERMTFKDFFAKGTSLSALSDGEYEATIKAIGWVEDPNNQGNNYVRVDLQLADRELNDNRFENGFRIFCSQIKRQLGMENQNIEVPELVKTVTGKKVRIWISNPVVQTRNGPQVRRNINYIPPVALAEGETASDDVSF